VARVKRLLAALLVIAALAVGAVLLAPSEDDERVEPGTAAARRAIAVALEVVPGAVTEVARDRDDGNWEVTVRQDGNDFEVELRRDDLELLGIDYD
jgi:uncharacterized membrane protein YkoI